MYSFMRIEKIDDELNSMFESPELLSMEKHRELSVLKEQIDKIYIKNAYNQVEEIYLQINTIFKSDEISAEDEVLLYSLEQKLHGLFLNKSKADISLDDAMKLEELNLQIDALFEIKEPTIQEIEKAELLLDEKEMRYASMFVQKGQAQTHLC